MRMNCMRKKGMVVLSVIGALAIVTTAAPSFADECDTLSCSDECRAERTACSGMRKTLSDWLKTFCKMDALDVRFDCVDAKTQADEDCGAFCGDEYGAC